MSSKKETTAAPDTHDDNDTNSTTSETKSESILSFLSSLPIDVRRRVYALKGIAGFSDTVTRHRTELEALEAKYAAEHYLPLRAKQQAIISGATEPTADQIAAGEAFAKHLTEKRVKETGEAPPTELSMNTGGSEESEAMVGIPEFWAHAMRGVVDLFDIISDEDYNVLKHVTAIRSMPLSLETGAEGRRGFRLEFEFAPNEFFTNSVLTKTFYEKLDADGLHAVRLESVDSMSPAIQWKSDEVNPTIRLRPRTERNRYTNERRVVNDKKLQSSFFHFFSPKDGSVEVVPFSSDSSDKKDKRKRDDADDDQLNNDDDDDVETESSHSSTSIRTHSSSDEDSDDDSDDEGPNKSEKADYCVALTIASELLPNSVQYFTSYFSYDPEFEQEGDDDDGFEDEEDSDKGKKNNNNKKDKDVVENPKKKVKK
eukprot:PhM_4_TR5451/c0_g1_i1/m.21817/K11279/NAP1L1, NRP; nucleosome assembly protein 1-like 1